jgi:hypothetical protein
VGKAMQTHKNGLAPLGVAEFLGCISETQWLPLATIGEGEDTPRNTEGIRSEFLLVSLRPPRVGAQRKLLEALYAEVLPEDTPTKYLCDP